MLIGSQFNRFYHGVLLKDIHEQAFKQHLTVENMDFLKQGLKKLDEKYPKNNKGGKKSITQITNKELTEHMEFIICYMGEYGITPHYIDDEWERLIKEITK